VIFALMILLSDDMIFARMILLSEDTIFALIILLSEDMIFALVILLTDDEIFALALKVRCHCGFLRFLFLVGGGTQFLRIRRQLSGQIRSGVIRLYFFYYYF